MNKTFTKSIFKWCFSTLGCPELNLDQALDLAKRYGIDCIEIRSLSNTIDISEILEEYSSSYPAKTKLLKENRSIVALNTSFGISANSDADRNLLLRTATITDQFGAEYLRVFGGFKFFEELSSERLEKAAQTIHWFNEIRRKKGFRCKILLETHDGYSSADRCSKLMNFMGQEIDILWDAHHTYRFAGESFEYSWNKLSRQIKHIHVKDSIPISGKTDKVTHTLPGQGTLPVKDLLSILKNNSFSGPVSLEWEKYWNKDIPALDVALDAIIKANWI